MRASEQLSEIQGVARFKFHEGKVEDFKRLCAELMDIVRAKDSGTLEFEIYLSDDESECVVYERYRDSEAVIDHGAHVGEIMQAIFATGSSSSALLGEPSAELTAMMAGSPVPVFRPFLSIQNTLAGFDERAPGAVDTPTTQVGQEPERLRQWDSQMSMMTSPLRQPSASPHLHRWSAELKRSETVLTGLLEDRSAVFGALAQIEALGLELLELRQIRAGTKSPESGDNHSLGGV